MSNNNFKEIENKVMSEIKSGRVKLRSKYIFLAKKLSINSGIAFSVILAVLFFSIVLFYMRATDSLKYLSFGKIGFLAFLESFPYLSVIVLILLLFAAGYLITKTEWSYKKPFKYFSLGILGLVLFIGSIIAYSGISENIEEQMFNNRMPGIFFKPFISGGIERRERGVAGKIFKIGDSYLILETPHGFEKISLPEFYCEKTECQKQFKIGQFIIAVGRRENDIFMVEKIKASEEGKFPPMIKRGIHRQFSDYSNSHSTGTMPLPPHLLNFEDSAVKCVDKCFNDTVNPIDCFDECIE